MKGQRAIGGLLAAGVIGIMAGCGGADVPDLVPATGTVTIDGEPASAVAVIFHSTDETPTDGASGASGPDGKYELMHQSGELGVEPGNYAVTFSKFAMPDGSPLPEGQSPTDVDAVEIIPEAYHLVDAPVHTATVTEDGGTFDFDIQTK